jgi:hypothetical protein
MLTGQSGPQASTAARVTSSLLQNRARPVTRREKRAYARQSIESCRTIAVRRLDGEGEPCGRWFLADIADVAEGGMCLIANEDQALEPGQWLLLDVRSHPDFGQLRLRAQLRWFTRAHFALSFGVAFATPLAKVPVLAVERRGTRRDPNQEDWALEEERQRAASRPTAP